MATWRREDVDLAVVRPATQRVGVDAKNAAGLTEREPILAFGRRDGRRGNAVNLGEPKRRRPPAEPLKPMATSPLAPNFDVELVSISVPEPGKKKSDDEPRGLFEFDRRDAVMATIGGLLVVAAIITGWGLSKALRSGPPTPSESTPEAGVPKEG